MSDFFSMGDEQSKEYASRFKYVYGMIGILAAVFFVRLWFLQVIQGSELRAFSEKNRIKETKIQAPRGMILDRENRILVENLPGFEVTLQPQYTTELEKTAEVLSQVLKIPAPRIVTLVQRSKRQNGPFRPVRIKDHLSRDEVFLLKLLRMDHPGLEISETVVRSYTLGPNGSQLFGYVSEVSKRQLPALNAKYKEPRFQQGDLVGKAGLEEVYDTDIRGEDGVSIVQVDAKGREAAVSDVPSFLGSLGRTLEATPGNSLVLTVDRDLQEVAHKAMADRGRIGAVVAMSNLGEILAWVNGPSYDPNVFSMGVTSETWSQLINDPFKPMRNKVIQDHVPPGSTFKALVALAGLEEKVITERTTHYCPGFLNFGRRPYHCHLKKGHGEVNVTQSLEQSCDVFFYKAGIQLGIDRIAKYASLFGLGKKTRINLMNENSGLVPTSDWKKASYGEEWQPGENLVHAIGQGFWLTTALQMAVAYNAIGTEGEIVRPFVVRKMMDPSGQLVREWKPEVLANVGPEGNSPLKVSAKSFQIVKEGLRMVVNGSRGTAARHKIKGMEMSGKTGTVQLRAFAADQIFQKCDSRPVAQRHHGWFVAYAPSHKPEIVVAVLAEHACSGSGGAGPIAKDIVDAYVKKYHPELGAKPADGVPGASGEIRSPAAPEDLED